MKRVRKTKPQPKAQIPRFDRNLYIKATEMRVITETGENLGVLKKEEALQIAQSQELDLVLINPQSTPPIAKIISWSKFKYEVSKKKRNGGKQGGETKEMHFKPFIGEGDIQHKVKRIQEFLGKGNKVKVVLEAKRGADRTRMNNTMENIITLVKEFGEIEGEIKAEGRKLSVIVK